jgi:hypothetical protein
MLNVAERRGLVEGNVAKKVKMPDPKNERDRFLSEEKWHKAMKKLVLA